MSFADPSNTSFLTASNNPSETDTETAAAEKTTNVFWTLAVALAGSATAAALVFGLPGLYLFALALVPVILVTLVLITWG